MSAVETLTPATLDTDTFFRIEQEELAKATAALVQAKTLIVTTPEEYATADQSLAGLKSLAKQAESKRLELVKPFKDFTTRVDAGFREIKRILEDAQETYRKPMSAFQARLAEERRKAEEEARLERERIAREEAAKVEAARKAQEEAEALAKKAQEEGDPFLALLAQEDAKDAAQASAQATQDAVATLRTAATLQPEAPAKVTGSASKTYEVWDFEVTDPALVPLSYRPIDTTAIARDVHSLKSEANIPGVRVFSRIEVK